MIFLYYKRVFDRVTLCHYDRVKFTVNVVEMEDASHSDSCSVPDSVSLRFWFDYVSIVLYCLIYSTNRNLMPYYVLHQCVEDPFRSNYTYTLGRLLYREDVVACDFFLRKISLSRSYLSLIPLCKYTEESGQELFLYHYAGRNADIYILLWTEFFPREDNCG